MLDYTKIEFYGKRGNNLNFDRIPQSIVEVHNGGGGFGAILQAIVDLNGNIIGITIYDKGKNYDPVSTTLKVVDKNGSTYEIPNNDITIKNGEITNVIINGTPHDFTFPSCIWKGNIYINEKISIGLIENENIFILEKSGNEWIYPTDNAKVAGNTDSNDYSIELELEKTNEYDTEAIFLFKIINERSSEPTIEKSNIISLDLGFGIDNIKAPMQFNIGAMGVDEGVFERDLKIYYKTPTERYTIGEVLISSEVEGEDPRLQTILDNLGIKINKEQEFIFRNSDINEELPNIKLLNKKRKEFILEHSNIIPFMGSYKGFFNVLNWLGYSDLRVREYWKNIDPNDEDFKELIPFDINQKNLNKNIPTPSRKWKKTSRFSLIYTINEETGEVDKWDLPETKDSFMFTIEEVLLKLFALKRYLKEKFLPLNARIYDITGEGIYFQKLAVDTWNDVNIINKIDYTREIDFTANKNIIQIGDLRHE